VVWDMNSNEEPPLIEGPIDAVAHLAQARNYQRFPEDTPEMFRVNVRATASLLNWAVKTGVRRFTFVSSGTVYEPFSGPLKEDAPLAPPGYLGASKLAAELLARPYGTRMALCVLRIFFPYGPGQTGRLIPTLIRRIETGEAITVARHDGLVFTPTYVDDVANVIAASLLDGWTGTLNVASRRTVTIQSVANQIGKLLGRTPRFERINQVALQIAPDLGQLADRYDIDRFMPLELGLQRIIHAPRRG